MKAVPVEVLGDGGWGSGPHRRDGLSGPAGSPNGSLMSDPTDPTFAAVDLSWQTDAACVGHDPDLWFPETGSGRFTTPIAKAICETCVVKADCLEFAELTGSAGIWGGTTERERRHPHGRETLDQLQQRMVVRRYGCGESAGRLAAEFNVSRRYIQRLVERARKGTL